MFFIEYVKLDYYHVAKKKYIRLLSHENQIINILNLLHIFIHTIVIFIIFKFQYFF